MSATNEQMVLLQKLDFPGWEVVALVPDDVKSVTRVAGATAVESSVAVSKDQE